MDLSVQFLINQPKVIQETFDDEVVIINLDSGNYYSLDKVGAELWGFIEQRATTGEMIETIARRYEGERQELEKAIAQFLSELEQEKIIAALTEPDTEAKPRITIESEIGESEISESETGESKTDRATGKPQFEVPVLHKFTDMQELLLLEPIHEVDETGWPHPSPQER